jgi:uncharacterized cupin superfamily protein
LLARVLLTFWNKVYFNFLFDALKLVSFLFLQKIKTMRIEIEQPDHDELEEAGVFDWPVWEHDEDKFDWYFDKTEHCYIIEGVADIVSEFDTITVKPGDYLIFPAGLECVWDIRSKIRKHYSFE